MSLRRGRRKQRSRTSVTARHPPSPHATGDSQQRRSLGRVGHGIDSSGRHAGTGQHAACVGQQRVARECALAARHAAAAGATLDHTQRRNLRRHRGCCREGMGCGIAGTRTLAAFTSACDLAVHQGSASRPARQAYNRYSADSRSLRGLWAAGRRSGGTWRVAHDGACTGRRHSRHLSGPATLVYSGVPLSLAMRSAASDGTKSSLSPKSTRCSVPACGVPGRPSMMLPGFTSTNTRRCV